MVVDMASTHMIVLPGGGYASHAPHEAEPVARWLAGIGVQASVFRYPLNVRHPVPLDALRAEISRRRAAGAQRIGLIGSRPAATRPGWRRSPPVHMFAHGPHGLGLAQGAGAAAIWTTLADDWIHEQS